MRLIDADELQTFFNEVSTGLLRKPALTKDAEHIVRASLMVTEMIQDAPTIDAVEVVRCRDCRYWKPYNEDKDLGECDYYGTDEYDDDFCSKPIYWKEIKPEK